MVSEFLVECMKPRADESSGAIGMLAAAATLDERKSLIELTQRLLISPCCQKQGKVVSDRREAETTWTALTRTLARHPTCNSREFTNTAVLIIQGPENSGTDHSTRIRH
jgi:hypothetical protein